MPFVQMKASNITELVEMNAHVILFVETNTKLSV